MIISVHSLDTDRMGHWHIPEETPVAFVYNRRNYAVMLATPADMADFALGFSLSERIINSQNNIASLEVRHTDKGIELHFKISVERIAAFDIRARRRNLIGTAGCGICGLENTDDLFTPMPIVRAQPISISKSALERAMHNFKKLQPINVRTKSVHGAAWVSLDGDIQLAREDVGRHNALDKLIGAITIKKLEKDGFLLMSSRCSYEIIDKAARAKIPAILSLSGPTNLALNKAAQANITIYARDKIGGVKRIGM
ncbi:MAG: formate dehydrogenase accessory sulfurtransferase FdhD [Robiginitomaculum sp.]